MERPLVRETAPTATEWKNSDFCRPTRTGPSSIPAEKENEAATFFLLFRFRKKNIFCRKKKFWLSRRNPKCQSNFSFSFFFSLFFSSFYFLWQKSNFMKKAKLVIQILLLSRHFSRQTVSVPSASIPWGEKSRKFAHFIFVISEASKEEEGEEFSFVVPDEKTLPSSETWKVNHSTTLTLTLTLILISLVDETYIKIWLESCKIQQSKITDKRW